MERVLDILLCLLALVGHAGAVIWLTCQIHAAALHHHMVRYLSGLLALAGIALPVVVAVIVFPDGVQIVGRAGWSPWELVALGYFGICCLIALGPVLWWFTRGVSTQPPEALHRSQAELIDLAGRLNGRPVQGAYYKLLAQLPFNQTFELEVSRKQLGLANLTPGLQGLTIAHLSDLHLSGRLERPYFEEIVHHANELDADLVAVTGDLVDKEPCIDWLPKTLGQLRAKHGVYFILGNHDLRVDTATVRRTLVDAGLIDIGGRWQIVSTGADELLVAGNELPWIRPAADLHDAPPPASAGGPLRLLLAHTPDQFNWARRLRFDLMLAGHNHGGQFQFPAVGPLLAPSRHGVKYASGTFYKPPTVMHVSRGISALVPVRFNCRPEITLLELQPAENGRPTTMPGERFHSQRA